MKVDTLPAPTANPAQVDILVNKPGHFVEEWIEGHAVRPAAEASPEAAAERLARACIADAEREGILAEEISDEVGDLKEYLADTVLAEAGRETGVDTAPTAQALGDTKA
ncbi:DUF768 domain-containing protein [Mesorhizobium sp. B1-1-5]|uniref:DUF768 domain-containing protein n=1 Tax=Mesorhizobium sp. B1-1-5 TaxID=2589979 RepID=UPI00112EE45E|nr:DUF768 domain-containing protein [Mesorhizobium sp. B1-1-5]TPO08126.1 DUF768 domain-containing protein [Mesorhizobium sp. B1-1-5]